MASPAILLPGDTLQSSTASAPKLGPNLHLLSVQNQSPHNIPPSPPAPSESSHTIAVAQAGLLTSDSKRNPTLSILPFPQARYVPCTNDLVIAQIHHSSQDFYHCMITPYSPHAFLAHLAFEGATKKTRPQLKVGELIYARVLSVGVGAGGEVELACVNMDTGKAEPEGLGPLTGGMAFDVSNAFATRLMIGGGNVRTARKGGAGPGGLVVLEELGPKLESYGGFEIAIGKNGRVWVDCSAGEQARVKIIVAIGRCLKETDERRLGVPEQKKLVSKILREMGLGK
ncbi:exosome non-catalytic core subunit rrp40 [Myotisia sp. PD_48]|nr:exosome non-catalytic core subunit rrp40 [Myotisia sp. PD_48]